MEELVFGIDHGNGNIKSENVCVPCGLVKYTSEPGRFMNEDILEYKGMYYTLSESRMPYKFDKTSDKDYFVLTLFVLAKEAQCRGINLNGKDVMFGIGVPPADFSRQASRFKRYFLDEAKHGITFKINCTPITFYLKDVQVSPQNFAAVFCYKASLFKQYRTVNCIDIGDGTVDLLVIRKSQPDLSVRVSERMGIAVLRAEIANAIQQSFGLQLESSDVEQLLMNEPMVLDTKVADEVHRMADEWLNRIVNRLHVYVPDFRINPTIFLGGGSQVLHEQIETSPDFNFIEFIDDIKANAIGYAMLVKARRKKY